MLLFTAMLLFYSILSSSLSFSFHSVLSTVQLSHIPIPSLVCYPYFVPSNVLMLLCCAWMAGVVVKEAAVVLEHVPYQEYSAFCRQGAGGGERDGNNHDDDDDGDNNNISDVGDCCDNI